MSYRHSDTLYPIDQLHEDDGCVLLWRVPICEPPSIGWAGQPETEDDIQDNSITHFSIIPNMTSVVDKGISMSYEMYEAELRKKGKSGSTPF